MVLGKLPVPGRPTIWITVGQGPTALAVGAGGACLDIFTLIYPFSPLSPSLWETARYRLKYCLKGSLNPKQPTNQLKVKFLISRNFLWDIYSLQGNRSGHVQKNKKCVQTIFLDITGYFGILVFEISRVDCILLWHNNTLVTQRQLGGWVVRWCWVNFQYQGILLICMIGQGPIALAVGAGRFVWRFFPSSIISLFFLPLSGRRLDIDWKTVSKGRKAPKQPTNNQPRDNQRNREQKTLLKLITSHIGSKYLSGNDLPRIKLFPDRYLYPIPACWFQHTTFVVVSCVGCLEVTGVYKRL